ncbi:MAG: GNAT family N-acetyltransferase [Spirochaetales bacterium]|nr:GNAT family N-acetyltransferase [Spirochaetales bacterium]
MSDMLVKLLEIPSRRELESLEEKLLSDGITIRRAMVPDMQGTLDFVEGTTGRFACGECMVCFSRQPVSCFVAEKDKKVIGYACYEATMRNFFGPTEVLDAYRGKGVGAALLLECLHSMRDMGYAYAIIGGVGPAAFYTKVCGAKIIENSDPGVYKDFLGKDW